MKSKISKAILLSSLVVGWLNFPESSLAQSGIIREVYLNVIGGTVAGLTNNPNFPNAPSLVGILDDVFEAPQNFADNYGQRLRGYLLPPQTGNYIFWLEADNQATLYLSLDENPGNKAQIAIVTVATAPREWNNPRDPNQKSSPIALQAGKRYYIEALMADNTGDDHVAVRWQLPDGTIEEPIPASRLNPEIIPPQIITQPGGIEVTEGDTATFTVSIANIAPQVYQWQRGGIAIPGATNSSLTLATAISDNGSRYRVVITNDFGAVTSADAVLTVDRDVVTPAVLSVLNQGDDDLVTVNFSEPMDPASATNTANYFINNGISVLGATLDPEGRTAVLKTSPLIFGAAYTMILNNIFDRADIPNSIDPDTTREFTFSYTPLDAAFIKGATEPLGPSSRRTGLVISEIMYNPLPRSDGKNLQFIELFNTLDTVENIGGFRLASNVDYTFPDGTFIPGRGFIVVGPAPADLETVYGIPTVYGGFTNSVLKSGGIIQLRDNLGGVLLEAQYGNTAPWPASPDGAGHSLVLARPSYGEEDIRAWAASDQIGGSAGKPETKAVNPYRTVLVNEFLAAPSMGFIELYNYGSQPVNISGCFLTDDPSTNKFTIPAQTTLAPVGFAVFNLPLNPAGGTIYLINPQRTIVIEAIRFGPQAPGVATGRFPDGAPSFRSLSANTPGAANVTPLRENIVINELMYHPISENDDDQYIELYNRGNALVDLSGWRFTSGIDFTFPAGAKLGSHGYLVVARNRARLFGSYTNLSSTNTFGDFNGALSHQGDRIALGRPQTFGGNVSYVLVDEVRYHNGGRWGQWSDGGGSSLELIDPEADNDFASNWADSDESAKSAWTAIEGTGILSLGNTNIPGSNLHVFLEGPGEALLDNVEVVKAGSLTNFVVNSTFENGTNNWIWQGNHEDTSLENSGYQSGKSLHIRATGRGDTASNRIRGKLRAALTNGTTVTLRAKARWLAGDPDILLRLHGNYLETTGMLSVPANLGTPGLPNSRAGTNAGPAIINVTHSPLLPAPNQDIVVSAQISGNNRIAFVNLVYRIDPSTNLIKVSMSYSGAGFYSGTIPGGASSNLVAFRIAATDAAGGSSIFPNDAPGRECLVLMGETPPSGTIGAYHIWLTQQNLKRWTGRDRSSTKALDATFVYNGDRVVYNSGIHYSGGPFLWIGYQGPVTNACNYALTFPKDDPFLGQLDFALNVPSNAAGSTDPTGIRERTFHWMAKEVGNRYAHIRYHQLDLNGNPRGLIYEDAQTPNADFIAEWFPDNRDGELHQIENWFEFQESFTTIFNVDATLDNFVSSDGTKKKERYRWTFRKAAAPGSTEDYGNLFALVDAVNDADPTTYEDYVRSLVDIDEWMAQIAMRHLAGDWDSYGYKRGRNMYAYKPRNGKWQLLPGDVTLAFGLGDPPTTDLFSVKHADGSIDSITDRMMKTPSFKRSYLSLLQKAVDGPMIGTRVNVFMDGEFASLTGNGISLQSPEIVKTWISQRRDFILSQLAPFASSFAITSNNGNDFTTNRNQVVVTGTAPLEVKTITVNGIAYPITWTSETSWTIRYALQAPVNALLVQGFDEAGNLIAGDSATITITYTGPTDIPEDKIVINEIMFDSKAPDAEFIELHNTSRTYAFDLSNYQFTGVDFNFTQGAIIPPGGFLLLVKDIEAFTAAYGPGLPVAGEYSGQLGPSAQTLTLLRPGTTNEIVVDSVHFDVVPPWPSGAAGTGASLQLIDPTRDSSRVANWAISITNATPGATNSVRASLPAFPLVWLNEVEPNNLTGIKDSSGARGAWAELYNSSSSPIDLTGMYLTDIYTNLTRWAFPTNTHIAAKQFLIVWLDGKGTNATAGELHTSFRLDPAVGAIALVGPRNGQPAVFDYLNYSNPGPDRSYGAFPDGQAVTRHTFATPTPGGPNIGIDLNALTVQAAIVSGNVILTWNSVLGAAYQVQFKKTLSDTAWILLKSVTASGPSTSTPDTISGTQSRFYRIVKQ